MQADVSPEENRSEGEPWSVDQAGLRREYNELLPLRTRMVRELERHVEGAVAPLSSSPRVKGRVKSFKSYSKKYIRYVKDGVSPSQIHDVIGIRVICPFMEDLATAEKLLREKFRVVDAEWKGKSHTLREFGYESVHLLIAIPQDIGEDQGDARCQTAEIQLRTIMQDAWAEVEHELIYKAEFTPFDTPLKRKLAALNASLSLADIIFQEIRSYQRDLHGELGKRRDSFFRKIEDSTDAILFTELGRLVQDDRLSSPESAPPVVESIDELLLEALSAHNKNQFSEAVAIYTRILEMKPVDAVRSLIYKHRGMAYFARSHYEEAIADFCQSLELDPKSYKAAYYQGIVYSVLGRYPQAVDAFNKSLAINSYQPYCLYRRGQAYYHLGDYPQALGDCEAALALEPFETAGKFKRLVLDALKM
ncbi:MAG: tetratricopeptide repeat protein [Treponema sp.]|nr:tetratricopeptide repeat protein [Treponema sp.]